MSNDPLLSHPSAAQKLLGSLARLEAAVRDHPSAHVAAILARRLADLRSAIAPIETMLRSNSDAPPDMHFAAERILDIATALRRRDVDAPLCDCLEATGRDVADAAVHHDAAAVHAGSAVAMLRDATRQIDDLMEVVVPLSEANAAAERFDDTGQQAVPQDDAAPSADLAHDDVGAAPVPSEPLPEIAATGAAGETAARTRAPQPLPMPSPLDAGPSDTKSPAPALIPAPELRADVRPHSRPALHDSLAALSALTEEELIALFS